MNPAGMVSSVAKASPRWCAPDAVAAVKLQRGCESESSEDLRTLLFPTKSTDGVASPVTMINVGANKGYEVVEFLERWAPERGVTDRAWYYMIKQYAASIKSKHLAWSAPGACKHNHKKKPRWQDQLRTSLPVRVHAFELNPRTAAALDFLVRNASLSDIVTVHQKPVSAEVQLVCTSNDLAGSERSRIHGARKRACTMQNSTTIDRFLQSEGIAEALLVEIDTEGHDAFVLAGMREALRAHRIRIVQFEYGGMWPAPSNALKGTDGTVRATLDATVRWMWEEAGYFCFFRDPLMPISPPCWSQEFEVRKWSNVLCAHRAKDLEVLGNASARGYTRRTRKRSKSNSVW